MEAILKYLPPGFAIHMNLYLMNMAILSVKTTTGIMREKKKDLFILSMALMQAGEAIGNMANIATRTTTHTKYGWMKKCGCPGLKVRPRI